MTKQRGSWWAYVPVGLLTAMVGGLVTLAIIANDDPAFAVERDYYKKAVNWEETQRQQRLNERLGWQIQLEPKETARSVELVARLVDGHGSPLRGAHLAVEAFHNARSADIFEANLSEHSDGSYRVKLPLVRPGLWELRFRASHDGARFTQIVRRDLHVEGS